MSAPALEFWTWVLIFGGLLLLCLGLFLPRASDLAWTLLAAGPALAAAGVALIFVRARLPETPSQNMPPRKE